MFRIGTAGAAAGVALWCGRQSVQLSSAPRPANHRDVSLVSFIGSK